MFLLYNNVGAVTARTLRRALGIRGGFVSYYDRVIRNEEPIIRWGESHTGQGLGPTILNEAEAIHCAKDKLRAFQKLAEAGVPIPNYSEDWRELPQDRVRFGRSRTGSGGNGIHVYLPGQECLPVHNLYTEYVPNDREYRIHIFNGNCIRVQKKILRYPERQTEDFLRNTSNGYCFEAPRLHLTHDRIRAASQAVAALGLNFGAVDLVVGQDNQPYVLEVNTAPACSPLTARKYVDAFVAHLQGEGYDITPDYDVLQRAEG